MFAYARCDISELDSAIPGPRQDPQGTASGAPGRGFRDTEGREDLQRVKWANSTKNTSDQIEPRAGRGVARKSDKLAGCTRALGGQQYGGWLCWLWDCRCPSTAHLEDSPPPTFGPQKPGLAGRRSRVFVWQEWVNAEFRGVRGRGSGAKSRKRQSLSRS